MYTSLRYYIKNIIICCRSKRNKKEKNYSNENMMVTNIYFFRQFCFVITSKTVKKNMQYRLQFL